MWGLMYSTHRLPFPHRCFVLHWPRCFALQLVLLRPLVLYRRHNAFALPGVCEGMGALPVAADIQMHHTWSLLVPLY